MKITDIIKRHLPPTSPSPTRSRFHFNENLFPHVGRRGDRLSQPSDVKQVATNTLIFALALVEKISECAPVPGLKGAVGGLYLVVDHLTSAAQNVQDFDELISSIDRLNNILSMFEDTSSLGRGLTDDLGEQLFMLSGKLAETKTEIEIVKNRSKVRRIIEAPRDGQSIIRHFRQLQGFINEIVAGSALKAEIRLADLYALEHLDKLPRAKDARYDYVNRPMCSEGTREGVLAQIMDWIDNKNGHHIYWLNGGAGTGKTTIALTVADMVSKDPKIFSASFFCSRESEGRSDATLIFPTLAYLFARCDVRLRNKIVQVIKESPDIGHALPKEQLSQLIIEPLRKVGSKRPILLVLDALDECTGGRAPETILTALASEIQSVPYLKVFVSSRPTSSTNDAFSNEALRQRREVFVLHDVEEDIVDADIRDYMVERLTKKAALRRLTVTPWPPEDLVNKLVRMAGGLFIFASTVCEFIEARGDLDFRLKEITDRPINEYTGIDGLYREILGRAIDEFPDRTTIDHCRSIIGTIILLQDPLSSVDLGQLLRLPPKHIQGILGDLQSVIAVPDDMYGTIRTLHASFHDFLSTRSRCLPIMYLDPTPAHRTITLRLLEIMMDGLKRNMSYFIRFKLNNEEHIPGFLRYACRYWADHLSCTDMQDRDDLVEVLSSFTLTKLVYCLEVLDSVGRTLDLSNVVLEKAEAWFSSWPQPPDSLLCAFNRARIVVEDDLIEQHLFSLFGLSPDTRYAQRGHGRLCSEGTRNEVLENILSWINDETSDQVFWLYGAAGSGKTAVALTIADLVAMDRSKMSSTFFCSGYSKYRSDVQHVFITLSIVLAVRDARFCDQLVQAIHRNPHVIQAAPKDQLRILIIEPLQRAGMICAPIVFVIDALDECKDEDAARKILCAFTEHLRKIPSLKVLISTRPSPPASEALCRETWMPRTHLCLHDVDRALVDEDIGRYLFKVLCTNASIVERLSMSWPPQSLLEKLVNKAGGLFIYASFIGEQFILVGTGKLEEIANHPGSEYEGNLGLNIFYGRILRPLVTDCDEEIAAQWRGILGIITHLWEPIPIEDFAQLVGMPLRGLRRRLLRLQSIIIVSGDKQLIRPIHGSLRDWLTDKDRSLPGMFVERGRVHREITKCLLQCMLQGLGRGNSIFRYRDDDAVGEGASLRDGGEDLLDYACRYWADHLVQSTLTEELQADLEWFVETKLVFWVERLDYSGILMLAATALESAERWYHEVSNPRHECVEKFYDAHQLMLERSMMTLT